MPSRRYRPTLVPYSWRSLLWAYERPKGDPRGKVPEVWVEVPLGADAEWLAAFRLFERDGAVGIAELRIFPHESKRKEPGRWSAETERLGLAASVPEYGLTARTLRELRFDEVRTFTREAVRSVQRQHDAEWRDPALYEWRARMLGHFRVFMPRASVRRGRGPTTWTDTKLARLAARYVELTQSGSRTPIPELASETRYSHSAIKKALSRARMRDLLTDTPRRRAGGALTNKAITLLEADDG